MKYKLKAAARGGAAEPADCASAPDGDAECQNG